MKRKLIAGNWKMNLNRQQAVFLIDRLAAEFEADAGIDVVVCPPHPYLDAVGAHLVSSAVKLGAQNMAAEPDGAFTGEVSANMLVDLGCTYVILGHSERRTILRETNEQVRAKTIAALAVELIPIVCLGESLADRQAGQAEEVVRRQFEGSMNGLSDDQMGRLVIAYEPVWAIGTGKVATPEEAEFVHADLRKMIENGYNKELAEQVRILYGGSVKPENAAILMGQPNVDGALVGGASLKADSFAAIIAATR